MESYSVLYKDNNLNRAGLKKTKVFKSKRSAIMAAKKIAQVSGDSVFIEDQNGRMLDVVFSNKRILRSAYGKRRLENSLVRGSIRSAMTKRKSL